ncbi:MAG: Fe(2+)-trafficking protein [Planctomycetota bacterium]
MDPEARIEQFRKLIEQDPTSDMAYFSLAQALSQAGRFDEAGDAFRKCTDLNPAMTKGFQLGGAAYMAAGKDDEARAMLVKGYEEAATRGDLMPKKAIADLLTQLGESIPEVKDAAEPEPTGSFKCGKTGRMGNQMARPPFRNGVGTWIHENISRETFDEFIRLGTKVINELRLDLSRDDHDAVYDYAMRRYMGITDELYGELMDGSPTPPVDAQFSDVIDEIMSRGGHLEDMQGEMHTRVES